MNHAGAMESREHRGGVAQILLPIFPSRSQSQRSVADGGAIFGEGATREMDRFAAALGLIEAAELRFECADDIANGGVHCAQPALPDLGLLATHTLAGSGQDGALCAGGVDSEGARDLPRAGARLGGEGARRSLPDRRGNGGGVGESG